MVERIDDQPTPDENLLRQKGVYHDRRSGKDRRTGYTVINPNKDRRKKERRKNPVGGIQESRGSAARCTVGAPARCTEPYLAECTRYRNGGRD